MCWPRVCPGTCSRTLKAVGRSTGSGVPKSPSRMPLSDNRALHRAALFGGYLDHALGIEDRGGLDAHGDFNAATRKHEELQEEPTSLHRLHLPVLGVEAADPPAKIIVEPRPCHHMLRQRQNQVARF